jgi:hypothetical protein
MSTATYRVSNLTNDPQTLIISTSWFKSFSDAALKSFLMASVLRNVVQA